MNVILQLWSLSSLPHWPIEPLKKKSRNMLQPFSGSFVNHIFREENFIEHYIARWTFIFNISRLVPHVIHLLFNTVFWPTR